VPVLDYARQVDSVMFCLSKGLSAPIGSMLVGPKGFIDYGRRVRKALGGGMRQVGVIAAAGLIALNEMTERLAEDHARAKRLARAISVLPGVMIDPAEVETNIIIFGFEHPRLAVLDFLGELNKRGIAALAAPGGIGIRMVTHNDVGDADVDRAVAAFREILS
jgi:threonine aldolase